ncbi:hypothetical protein [Nonomuraea sp. NPDC050783]|uniref:hypothetical protein n=1 Tax=Nonomuraea sp. NPDC050783 TaxID=3154634 RepID=UPI003466AB0B
MAEVFSGFPPLLKRILKIAGLRTAFKVEASMEEPIQAMQASPQPDAPEGADPSD